MQEENKKSFLEELQSLDETTKKKVVIATTVVIMIGIIYFWLAYFNVLIGGASQSSAPVAAGQAVTMNNQSSFIATIENDFSGMAQALYSAIKSPGKYVIKPQ